MINRMRIGLVGCGNMGSNHLRALSDMQQFDLRWVLDPHVKPEAVSGFKGKIASQLTPELIGEIDGAIVAVPTESHFIVCSKLLRERVPVLVEKPICRTVSEAQRLRQLSDDQGVPLFVGHIERFNPAVEKVRQLVHDGFLGNIIHLNCTRIGRYPSVRSVSNNVLIDLAVHDLDVVQTIVGPLNYVSSICHSVVGSGIYDTAEINVVSENGASASIHANWVTPTKVRKLRVTGTKGVCFVDYLKQSCVVYRDVADQDEAVEYSTDYQSLYRDYLDLPHIVFEISREEPLKRQLQAWYRVVHEKQSCDVNLCTPEQGIFLLKLAESAIERAFKIERKA